MLPWPLMTTASSRADDESLPLHSSAGPMGYGLPRRDAVGVCPVVLHATRHVTGVGLQRGFKVVCIPIAAKASRTGGQPLPSSLPAIDPPETSPLLADSSVLLADDDPDLSVAELHVVTPDLAAPLASGSFPLASPASYKVVSSGLTHNAVTIVVAASAPINFGIWSAGGVSLSPPAALCSPMGAVAKDPLPPFSSIATALARLLPSPASARSSLPHGNLRQRWCSGCGSCTTDACD